jgi:hypothetical protein
MAAVTPVGARRSRRFGSRILNLARGVPPDLLAVVARVEIEVDAQEQNGFQQGRTVHHDGLTSVVCGYSGVRRRLRAKQISPRKEPWR